MSLLTRVLAILLALASLAGGLALRYGRHEAARALQAEQRLAMAIEAQAGLQVALETQQHGMAALRSERQAQESRLRTADHAGAQARRAGEARTQAVLMAPAPEDPQSLVRWAAAQTQSLNHRLESPQ